MNRISLENFKNLLAGKELLPGRRMLRENLGENFGRIAAYGIKDLSGLKAALSSPEKIRAFSIATGVPEEYLVLLKREAGSLEQKPLPVAGYLHMNPKTAALLQEAGIRTSRDYYEFYRPTPDSAAERLGIDTALAQELFCISDLVRINGVGAAAAQAFFEAGYKSAAAVAGAKAEDLLERVTSANSQKHFYNAKLGQKDMQFCIDYAKILLLFEEEGGGLP